MTLMRPTPSPSAALVHTVVAAGLADAQRLQAWQARPVLLAELGVDPSTMDLDALACFAGLSEMIRHNLCRADLQQTFRLLLLTGLEIELFRDYAPRSLARRRQGLKSTADRLDGLLEFVKEWASGPDPLRRLIRDMLQHEHIVATVRSAEIGSAPNAATVTAGLRAIPVQNGFLRVQQMSCDPRQVSEVLRDRDPDLARIARGSWTFAYHSQAPGSLRMLEIDRGVGDLILVVDGQISVEGIGKRLLGNDVPARSLVALFSQLTELGLFTWRSDAGTCHAADSCR